MKRNELKIKAMLYGAIAAIMENEKDFISKLAEIIHEENTDKGR